VFNEILLGKFEAWHGMQALLTIEDLAKRISARVVQPPSERTRISSRYMVYELHRPTSPAKCEAWILATTAQVAILEIEDPVCPDIEATLTALGPSDIILKDQRLSADYRVSEYVFPQRGMTLSVGARLLPPGHTKLLHARLFPSMSLQRYLTSVGEPNPALPDPG
jgi:hypothetical protein